MPSAWNMTRLKGMNPKGCWVTSVKIANSDAIISWSEKAALFGLHRSYLSHPSAIKIWTQVYVLGLILSMTSVAPRIMWSNSLSLLLPFLHIASDQKLEVRRPGNEARWSGSSGSLACTHALIPANFNSHTTSPPLLSISHTTYYRSLHHLDIQGVISTVFFNFLLRSSPQSKQ